MWWPEGLSTGRCRINARTTSGSAKGYFSIPPLPDIPLVNVWQLPKWSFPNASPLEEPKENYIEFKSIGEISKYNDQLKLYGANFKPDSTTLVGLYAKDYLYDGPLEGQAVLIAQGDVQANRRGEWEFSYRINPRDPAGEYFLVVVLCSEKDNVSFAGL